MRKILFSGVFDLFHCGHFLAMKQAKSFGDKLIVHVASDKETRAVKGAERPVIPGDERATIIEGLKCVDEVIYEPNYLSYIELLERVAPDILILNLGGNPEGVEEECAKRGITIIKIPRQVPDSRLDTTKIIEKIRASEKPLPLSGINFLIVKKSANTQVVIQKRDNKKEIQCPGMWAIPGGAIDSGEDALLAAAREIKEETGLDVYPDELEMVCDHTFPWGDTNRFFILYVTPDTEVQSNEGKMTWIALEDLNSYELAGDQNKIIPLIDKTIYGE